MSSQFIFNTKPQDLTCEVVVIWDFLNPFVTYEIGSTLQLSKIKIKLKIDMKNTLAFWNILIQPPPLLKISEANNRTRIKHEPEQITQEKNEIG